MRNGSAQVSPGEIKVKYRVSVLEPLRVLSYSFANPQHLLVTALQPRDYTSIESISNNQSLTLLPLRIFKIKREPLWNFDFRITP